MPRQGHLNSRNIGPAIFDAPAHGFANTDRKAWGGLMVRHDGTNWVKAVNGTDLRAEAVLMDVIDINTLHLETIPGEDYIEVANAATVLTAHTDYYCAADGDLSTTVSGARIARNLGGRFYVFFDANAGAPVIYAKRRLTVLTQFVQGEVMTLSTGAGGVTGSCTIHATFNGPITLEADAAAHDTTDNLWIKYEGITDEPDTWAWVSTDSWTVPRVLDVGDIINIKQRAA